MLYLVISIFILILCVVLSLVVLVQNPKGGGLTQSLGGVSSQVFGAKNSAGLVEKITWYLAIAIVILSLTSVMFLDSTSSTTNNVEISTAEEVISDGGDSQFNPNAPVEAIHDTSSL